MSNSIIVHCDLDCFYAQVEQVRLGVPSSQPLAVQQWNNVIAVNYASRVPFGVKRGMSADECKRLCPNIVLAHVEYMGDSTDQEGPIPNGSFVKERDKMKVCLERYRLASEKIMAIFQRYCPKMEKAGTDEAFFELAISSQECNEESTIDPDLRTNVQGMVMSTSSNISDNMLIAAAKKVCEIRQTVFDELGYTVSAGIAGNKLLAKQASASRKPNKQTLVPLSCVEYMMKETKLSDLRGLGGKLGQQVAEFTKAATAYEIQQYDIGTLCSQFGHKCGSWLFDACRGVDHDTVKPVTRPKSLLTFKTFKAIHDIAALERWTNILCEELHLRIANEEVLHRRRPRSIVVHHTSSPLAATSTSTHGSPAAPTLDRNRLNNSASTTSSKTGKLKVHQRTPSTAELVVDAMLLVRKIPNLFPCKGIGIGVTEMYELPPSSGHGGMSQYFGVKSSVVHDTNKPITESSDSDVVDKVKSPKPHCAIELISGHTERLTDGSVMGTVLFSGSGSPSTSSMGTVVESRSSSIASYFEAPMLAVGKPYGPPSEEPSGQYIAKDILPVDIDGIDVGRQDLLVMDDGEKDCGTIGEDGCLSTTLPNASVAVCECAICGQAIPLCEVHEHSDFHAAQRLQEQLQKENDVIEHSFDRYFSSSSVGGTGNCSEFSPGHPRKKAKKQSISSFFNKK